MPATKQPTDEASRPDSAPVLAAPQPDDNGAFQSPAAWIGAGSALLTACGGGGDAGTSSAAAATDADAARLSKHSQVVSTRTDAEAARFLQQAQFASTKSDIQQLRGISYSEWLQQQYAKPQGGTGWNWLHNRPGFNYGDPMHPSKWYLDSAPADFMIWSQLLDGADPVRRRMALALSEFFVVSLPLLPNPWRSQAITAWWDLLVSHAFGNFRQLLEAVTLNPAMGAFLNTLGNRKADASGRVPDENYSREVMQLFTIGLFQLEPDGRVKNDASGQPLECYTQDDVTQLARVFTGYLFDYANDIQVPSASGVLTHTAEYLRRPMRLVPDRHSTEAINFLGTSIAAGTPGEQALKSALDTLFQHPNVGPFFGRQMIQRLVTSNPSPAYVARVAAAFNNNGSGVRGDLRAVWSAILLDPEARHPLAPKDPLHGKLREPILRFVQWARSFGARSAAGSWKLFTMEDPAHKLGQSPLRAPSVFNFFRPGYVPPAKGLATRKAVAPELQIAHETSVSGYLNFMQGVIRQGIKCPDPLLASYNNPSVQEFDFKATYRDELALVDKPESLIQHLDTVLTAGQLPQAQRELMTQALIAMAGEQVAQTTLSDTDKKLNRVSAAVLMVMSSTAYLVQK